ncbi:MAG TPA: sugar phosphate isomerase/epimerase [Abditibacteriaceae bacterium]|jgi:sugar phosphate isomerase/epimerase
MAIACSTSVACNSSLDKALETVHNLGFRNVDILTIDGWAHVNTQDLADDFVSTRARVEALLQQCQLTPIATNSGVSTKMHLRSPEINQRRRDETLALVKWCNSYDIDIAAIQPPLYVGNEHPWEEVLEACVSSLREQKQIGDENGVRFALELHVNSPFETMEEARRFCDAMPEMPLVYDPTHFVMQGIDIRQTGWLMERAIHVHLRDAVQGKIQEHFGQGAVDFDWVLGALKDRGYQGHFSIEYLEDKNMDVLEDAKRARDAIAQYFPE